MYICSISIKGRYGWKTVTVDKFMRSYSMAERLSTVSDPTAGCCVNEFGELIEPEQAAILLEELEAHRCVTAIDLSLFLKIYTEESQYRVLVEQKLATALETHRDLIR